MIPRLALVVVCLVGAAVAVPLRDSSRCSTECSPRTIPKLMYEPDQTYTYKYTADNRISTDGTEGVNVAVEALVDLTVVEGCEYAIQFRNTKLVGPSDQDAANFARHVEANPLYFHFDDGRVGEVCPTHDEPEWVLNVKRGFLSAIQNSMNAYAGDITVDEVDLLGTCETKYSMITRSWRGVVITKTKDMRTCRNHHAASTSLFPKYIYTPESHIHNLPLFNSNYTCNQTMENNVVKSIKCTEKNSFNPLVASRGKYEVLVKVNVELEGPRDRDEVRRVPVARHTNLLFEEPQPSHEGAIAEAETDLRELCILVRDDVRPKAPKIYNRLAHSLKRLHLSDLERLLDAVKKQTYCPSPKLTDLFLDAVARAQSGPTQQLMASLIQRGEVSELRAAYWYLLLSMAQETTEDAIRAFLPILRPSQSRFAYLGVTSMVGHWCEARPERRSSPAVRELVSALTSQIPTDCKTSNKKEEEKVHLLLRALGNVGVDGDLVDTVLQCTAKELPASVRMLAFEAFRHVPCQEKVVEAALSTLKDEGDPCILSKIFAFRHVMECPKDKYYAEIVNIYNAHTLNQLLTYMYTYMSNLLQSDDPSKQDHRSVLSGYYFEERVEYDIRDNSVHFDFAHHLDALNFGFTDSVDLIFGEDSFVPRYFSDNLNLRSFGYFNDLFQVSAFVRGTEKYLEEVFGPEGFLKNLFEFATEGFGPDYRTKRSAKDSKLDVLHERMQHKFANDRLEIFGALRVFGKDLFYLSFDDLVDFLNEEDESVDLRELTKKLAQNRKYELSRGFMLLDTTVTVPTISGLPMKFDVNGTAVVGLTIDGKIDLRDLENLNVDVDCSVDPSLAVELGTSLTIDAHYTRPGMKLVANLHSSVPFGVKVHIQNGELMKVAVKLPKEKLELVHFRVNAYEIGHSGEQLLNAPRTKKLDFCTNFLGKPFGLEVCVDVDIPRPIYSEKTPFLPFSVPLGFSVVAQKADTAMEGYQLTLQLPSRNKFEGYMIEFDTPGSSVDRQFRAQIELIRQKDVETLRAELKTPFDVDIFSDRQESKAGTRFILTGSVRDIPEGRIVEADLTVNQVKRYSVQVTEREIDTREQTLYQYAYEVQCPHEEPRTGNVFFKADHPSDSKINAEFLVESSDFSKDKPVVKATYNQDGPLDGDTKVDGEVVLNLEPFSFTLQGSMERRNKNVVIDRVLHYVLPGRSPGSVRLITKAHDLSTDNVLKIKGTNDLTVSEFPEYNTHSRYQLHVKPDEHFEAELVICKEVECGGPEDNRFFVLAKRVDNSYEGRLQLKVPLVDLDYESEVNSKLDRSVPSFEMDVKGRDHGRDLPGFALSYKRVSDNPIRGKAVLVVRRPGKPERRVEVDIEKVSDYEYKGESYTQWINGELVKLEFVYKKNDDSGHKQKHTLDAKVIPRSGTPMIHSSELQISPTELKLFAETTQNDENILSADVILSLSKLPRINVQSKPLKAVFLVQGFDTDVAELTLAFERNDGEKEAKKFHLSGKIDSSDPDFIHANSKMILGELHESSSIAKLSKNVLLGPHTIETHCGGKSPHTSELYHHIGEGRLRTGIKVVDQQGPMSHVELSGKLLSTDTRTELGGKLIWDLRRSHGLAAEEISFELLRDTSTSVRHLAELHYVYHMKDHYRLSLNTNRPKWGSYGDYSYVTTVETPVKGYETQSLGLTGVWTGEQKTIKLEVTQNSESLASADVGLETGDTRVALQGNVRSGWSKLKSLHGHVEYNYPDSQDLDTVVNFNGKDLFLFKANTDKELRKANFKLNTFLTPRATLELTYFQVDGESGYKYNFAVGKQQFTAIGKFIYDPNLKVDIAMTHKGDKLVSAAFSRIVTGDVRTSNLVVRDVSSPFSLQVERRTSDVDSYSFNYCRLEGDKKCLGVDLDSTFLLTDEVTKAYLQFKLKRNNELYLSLLLDVHEDEFLDRFKVLYSRDNRNYGFSYEDKHDQTNSNVIVEITLPSRVVRYARQSRDQGNEASHEIVVLPDSLNNPNKVMKLTFDYKMSETCDDDSSNKCELQGKFELHIPEWSEPQRLKFHVKEGTGENNRPFDLRAELQFSPQLEDQFILNTYLQSYPEDENRNTIVFEFYDGERKTIDTGASLDFKVPVEQEDVGKVHLQWHWLGEDGEKRRGYYKLEASKVGERKVRFDTVFEVGNIDARGTEYLTIDDEKITAEGEYTIGEWRRKMKTVHVKGEPCTDWQFFGENDEPYSKLSTCINREKGKLFTVTEYVYREGQPTKVGSLIVEKLGDSIFDVHISWAAERVGEIVLLATDLPQHVESLHLDEVLNVVQRDLWHIYVKFNRKLLGPVCEFFDPDVRAIRKDLSDTLDRIAEGLERLEKQIDIEKILEKVENLLQYVEDAIEKVEKAIEKRIPKELVQKLEKAAERLEKYLETMCDEGTACDAIKDEYHRNGFIAAAEEFVKRAREFPLEETLDDLYETLKEIVHAIPGATESLEKMQKYAEEAVDYIEDTELARKIKEYVDWDSLDKLLEEYVKLLVEGVKQAYKDFLESQVYKKTLELIEELKEDVKNALNHWDQNRIVRLITILEERVYSHDIPHTGIQILSSSAESGDFRFRLKLPFRISDLKAALAEIRADLTAEDEDEDGPELPPYDEVTDTLVLFMSELLDEWIPPYSRNAYVIDGHHFVTFDGTFYDFAGKGCSYVLARDFRDARFTLLIKYGEPDANGKPRANFVFVTGDKRWIEIDTLTGQVSLDGTVTELPIHLRRVAVTREGHRIVLEDRSGVHLEYFPKYDLCHFAVSGWHFGKTGGLFGTMDNEDSNDFQRPNGKITNNVNSFVKSWEAEQSCKTQNILKKEEAPKGSEGYEVCRKFFFEQESSLRDCYYKLHPEEYFEMCTRHVTMAKHHPVTEAACEVAAAYVKDCSFYTVFVDLPSECAQCRAENFNIPSGEEKTLEASLVPQSADVVFILEEHVCNEQFAKELDSISKLIERDLTESGLTNNRYAVIAYGAQSMHGEPHVHTARGKTFFSSQDVAMVVEKMKFQDRRRDANVLGAIHYALDHIEFRPGVSKNLVLFKCSTCSLDWVDFIYNIFDQSTYWDVQEELLNGGAKLHVIGDDPIEVTGSPSKSKNVFALDANTVYRAKDAGQKELIGQPDLRKKLAIPNDPCVVLAQEVDGSYFVSRSGSDLKNWKSLLARRVAKTAQPASCQKCHCLPADDEDLAPWTDCTLCETPKPKTAIKVFTGEDTGYLNYLRS